MNKPITVEFEDFKNKLADVINNCALPSFVIELVLKEYLQEVHKHVSDQYMMQKKQYENSLVKEDIKKEIFVEGDSDVSVN